MSEEHANVTLLKRLDITNIAAATDLFAEGVVFHYFNPRLPDVQGDYVGLNGIGEFFETIGARTEGSFKIEPVSVTPVGDELVITHTRNTMTIQDKPIALDVVVVWRIVEGRIAEVWDIPSAYSQATTG